MDYDIPHVHFFYQLYNYVAFFNLISMFYYSFFSLVVAGVKAAYGMKNTQEPRELKIQTMTLAAMMKMTTEVLVYNKLKMEVTMEVATR